MGAQIAVAPELDWGGALEFDDLDCGSTILLGWVADIVYSVIRLGVLVARRPLHQGVAESLGSLAPSFSQGQTAFVTGGGWAPARGGVSAGIYAGNLWGPWSDRWGTLQMDQGCQGGQPRWLRCATVHSPAARHPNQTHFISGIGNRIIRVDIPVLYPELLEPLLDSCHTCRPPIDPAAPAWIRSRSTWRLKDRRQPTCEYPMRHVARHHRR
jgi:hypothetical protein